MFDLKIFYMSGSVEYKTPQTLGVSYGGGCLIESAFISADEMETKGIRATISYMKPFDDGEEIITTDLLLVAPEHLCRVFMIFDNERLFMCRNANRLLNPTETQAFIALGESI